MHIGGVPAYSTLGWFDDPLLSTFIRYPDAQLARLIFHELAHQVAYARDDTTFNESFAVAVEEEGVRRWLEAEGRAGELQAFRDAQARRREFAQKVKELRDEPRRVRTGADLPPEAMRAARRRSSLSCGREYPRARAGGSEQRLPRLGRALHRAVPVRALLAVEALLREVSGSARGVLPPRARARG